MIVAHGLKRFRGSFHGVVAQRTVHVKIDKAGRKIISVEVKNGAGSRVSRRAAREGGEPGGEPSPRVSIALLSDCSDFSLFNDDLKTIANSIGKNQTRVRKNHVP